jgi:hypothetical protein
MIPRVKIKVLRTTAATGDHLEPGDTPFVTESDARILIKMGKAVLFLEQPAGEKIEQRPAQAISTRGRPGRPRKA